MKITKLELKNFKRFDDLTIDLTTLAEPAKLVLLIGTNGSGKSSVFDAFEMLNKVGKHEGFDIDLYYKKDISKDFEISVTTDSKNQDGNNFQAKFISGKQHQGLRSDSFYGRTSVRQVPKLTRRNLGQHQFSFEKDSDRPRAFIERDNRFENDIEKVTSDILSDVFRDNTSTAEIRESYINPINRSFDNIFGIEEGTRIKLVSIKPPLEGKTAEILFKKGNSQIPYDFLSSGEKEIFNILLNLLTRKEYFQDSVYFLDEIDLHLNTVLQRNLLKEITENWIPDNCQLWTASHSLGFIEHANETGYAAIVDFDNLNFDVQQVIYPSEKSNFDVFEIAVSKEFLSKAFQDKRIFFAENTDTPIYNNLNIDNTIFFNGQNKADVFHKTKNNPSYNGLIDRDYLTDEERVELLNTYKNLYILNYYSIENYLFHPENLDEYYKAIGKEFDKNGYVESIMVEKKVSRDKILLGLTVARDSYPFYRENENAAKLKTIRPNSQAILQMFDSDDFEIFYKVFPAKDYGGVIKERQNISRNDLAKTKWFKSKIEEVLVK
ncbi:MAG TPA: AAA family ATPase [Mucilaginibacter sp.]|jgi:AAA15 family ATPase/GTPase